MSRPRKALIIEDTPNVQRTFGSYFDELGWDAPTIVSRGEEALRILQDSPGAFDVIILDQKLPGMSGVDTLAAARECVGRLPPVVMITAVEKAQVFSALAEKGVRVDAYMPKGELETFRTLGALLAQVLGED